MSSIYLHRKRQRFIFSLTGISLIFCLGMIVLFSSSCQYYRIEKQLDPENADWLNKVRYIITSKERRLFLDLPTAEKEQFKEDFWKRRDPDLGTEENEFKMEYFNRIERSNHIFISEGRAGWLTDRGRIFVLFGPPMDRITYPQGFNRCQEIWYYGNFPVVFIDQTCTGKFVLVTYNLSSIQQYNLMYMHEFNLAQARAQQTIKGQDGFFNFDWKIKTTLEQPERIEGMVFIETPYANIWFKEADGILKTILEVHLELRDKDEMVVWEHDESFHVEISEEELSGDKNKEHQTEIPFVITKDVNRLRQGRNKFFIQIINQTGDAKLRKVLDYSIK